MSENYFCVKPFGHISCEKVQFDVRCGMDIKVGDWFGGVEILAIQAYGKDFKEISAGMTCRLTMSGMPSFVVLKDEDQERIEWLKSKRKT